MKCLSLLKRIVPLLGIVLIGAFALGYYYTDKDRHGGLERPEETEMVEQDAGGSKDGSVMDYAVKPRINPDTRLILKVTYLRCGHTVIDRRDIEDSLLGLDEEGLLRLYPGWDTEKYDSDEIILSIQVEGACPGHYLLKENNGYIAVYKTAAEGKEIFIRDTKIPLSILRLGDQNRIRNGLLLDSLEEVERYIEDFGS